MVNIGSLSTGGRVIAVKADLAKIALTTPVCTEVLEKIALSRRCTLEIIIRVWIVNLYFQDRQALEVDRLGSDQTRNPSETHREGLSIHPYATYAAYTMHIMHMLHMAKHPPTCCSSYLLGA